MNTSSKNSKKAALLLTALIAPVLLGGCGTRFYNSPTGSSRQSVKSAKKECKPSQYWDGETCRHKGKGKGARKHDD